VPSRGGRPHLTDANHASVLAEAKGKTLRELEELVARLAPRPDAVTRIARLPERPAVSGVPAPAAPPTLVPAPAGASAGAPELVPGVASMAPPAPPSTPPPRTRVEPLSPERYLVRVTVGAAARKALTKALDLSRDSEPGIDEAVVIERALMAYAESLESRRFGKPKGPVKPASAVVADAAGRVVLAPELAAAPVLDAANDTPLHVSKHTNPPAAASSEVTPPERRRRPTAATRREVYDRDGGRCTFRTPDGKRCTETSRLHLHHIKAWALGGETTAKQLTLRCRAHNQHQAELDFGPEHIARAVRRRRRSARKRVLAPPPPGV